MVWLVRCAAVVRCNNSPAAVVRWWGDPDMMEISKYGRYIHLLLWTGLSHQAPREEQTRSLGGDARNILQPRELQTEIIYQSIQK